MQFLSGRQWLKPPGTLLLLLFLLTLLSVSALAWLGWRFLEQEHLVDAQRRQQRLEETADRFVAALRSALAESADRLSTDVASRGSEVAITMEAGAIRVAPGSPKLLFTPDEFGSHSEGSVGLFAEGEMFEFVRGQPELAAGVYRRIGNESTREAEVRAGALLRLARVLHASGGSAEARSTWNRLANSSSYAQARVAGVPVQLAALLETGDHSTVLDGLREGRWQLTRAQFFYFWGCVAPPGTEPNVEQVAWSDAAAFAWSTVRTSAQEIVWAAGRPWLVICRVPGESRRAMLITSPESWLQRTLKDVPGPGTDIALVDSQGRVLAGRRTAGARAAIRPAGETRLPWTVYAGSVGVDSGDATTGRERLLISGIAVMVTFLMAGTYFIGRAIRREAEVARMQSNFVAAVSHEFRSPLTSLRQLSEMLASGRLRSEERRQLYYDTLVRETTRLQRVVEALLTFGSIESRSRVFRMQAVDVEALVDELVREFAVEWGHRIVISVREAEHCTVHADRDALGVALRNLIDNAVRYSPDSEPVILSWMKQGDRVRVSVTDRGPGIERREQRAIFQKFVRGTAAVERNVKGSGVGLAMVRDIAAAHRGDVSLESRPGEGSTFTLTIPVSAGEP